MFALQKVWDFTKRHRRKLIFTGAVAGGLVALARLAKWRLEEWQKKEAEESLRQAKKQHHFDNNQRTCNITALSLLPNLRQRLGFLLDTDLLTNLLKQSPDNKIEIWEELKIKSFARTISAIYGVSLLFIVLRVQLNILGGYMYVDSLTTSDSSELEEGLLLAPPSLQKKFLVLIEYLLGKGVEDLTDRVRSAVTTVVGSLSLKEQLTLRHTEEILADVRNEMEFHPIQNGCQEMAPVNFIDFVLPTADENEEASDDASSDDVLLKRITTDLRDVLDSSDFQKVLTACVGRGFSHLLGCMAQFFRPANASSAGQSDTIVVNANDVSMPLAKIIPIVNGLVNTVCTDHQAGPLIKRLLLIESMNDFAANIYETFSEPPILTAS